MVNGHKYNIGYFLSNGIYQKWATFVKTICLPQGPKGKLFAKHQESGRKDVKRAFRVLQAQFAIIRGAAWHLEKGDFGQIMKACVILHSMIVEAERDSYDLAYDDEHVDGTTLEPNVPWDHHPCYVAYLRRVLYVQNLKQHTHLQLDLIEDM